MSNDTLPVAAVRMVISGSIVERRDTHEVLSMIDSRLRSSSSTGLAVGSVNPDHLHHFRTVSTAPSGQLEWLLLADGMPIAWRGQLLTSRRRQLICHPGVYYAGPPSGDRAERPGGAPEPASA